MSENVSDIVKRLVRIESLKQEKVNEVMKLKRLLDEGKRVKTKLKISERELKRLIEAELDLRLSINAENGSNNNDIDADEKSADIKKIKTGDLLDLLKERGYFVSKVPPTVSGKTFEADPTHFDGNKYRFAVISCTHLGSKHQQMKHLYTFYSACLEKQVNLVLHCGDLVDGMRIYKGQEYEVFLHGADEQEDYAVENYPKMDGIKTMVILGNHDESFWKHAGVNVLRNIARRRDDIEYLGDYLAQVKFAGIEIAIMHGDGGVAYARSYKPQKIVEQLAPERKPHMLFIGHWHVQCYIPAYRNVETFSMGAFQSQNSYLVRKALFPNIGGVIVDVTTDETGLKSVKPEWIPFYIPVVKDY